MHAVLHDLIRIRALLDMLLGFWNKVLPLCSYEGLIVAKIQ